jgi:hypothetical protein
MKTKISIFLIVFLVLFVAPHPSWSQNIIYSCITKSTGNIRIVPTPNSCKSNEALQSWNVAGTQGPQGIQGIEGIQGPVGPQGPPGLPASTSSRVYRWNVFNTYYEGHNWIFNNDASLFGGVIPAYWTDGNATAAQISSDKEVQRTLFVNKGYPGKNATVYADRFMTYSSTDGKVVVVLFRVKNNAEDFIQWPLSFRYTCYASWSEKASVALNGQNVWVENVSSYGDVPATVTLSIPPNRTSTVIVVSTSGPHFDTVSNGFIRVTGLAFVDDSLELPTDLEFIDDLETATGGYDQ